MEKVDTPTAFLMHRSKPSQLQRGGCPVRIAKMFHMPAGEASDFEHSLSVVNARTPS
jgi:hypothetical protein